MGIIRGSVFTIASVLLLLSFLAGNLFLTLSMSLEYDNVRAEVNNIIKDLAEGGLNLTSIVEEKFDAMEIHCQNNSEYVFSEEGRTFVVSCDVVANGPEAVVDAEINKFVEETYYKDYDCNFWNCFKESELPLFLISAKAKDYWQEKFYFSLIASIVLIILMFFLIEKKTNLPIVVGILLVISSLPFLKLDWFFSLLQASDILSTIFNKSHTVFLISLVLGLIFVALWLLLEFFKIGFKISEFFSKKKSVSEKEVKDIVKKEVLKEKKKSK